MARRRLGILGGTFDPVHHGHLLLALYAREQLDCDEVLLIPNAHSPFKAAGPQATFADRLQMIQAAIRGIPGLACSDLEGRRGGVSFMIDTLGELRAQQPADEFVLILGSDAYRDLPSWREAPRIRTLAGVAVVARSGEPPELASTDDCLIRMPRFDVSASEIRARVEAGRRIDFLAPASVIAFIFERRLYHVV